MAGLTNFVDDGRLGQHLTTTSLSLLQRLKTAPPESNDWVQLDSVYRPMIVSWARRGGVADNDVQDVAQNVLLSVSREIPSFERRATGAFRGFLRAITIHRIHAYWRDRRHNPAAAGRLSPFDFLDQLSDPRSPLSREWDQEHDRVVFKRLLEIVKPDFQATTWSAFERFVLDDVPAIQVALELGITENAIYLAKSRVLSRLREESAGLLD